MISPPSQRPIVCLGILVADVVGRPLRSVPAPGRLVLVDEISLHTGVGASGGLTGMQETLAFGERTPLRE